MKTTHRITLIFLLVLPFSMAAQDLAGTWKMSVPDENGEMMTMIATISEDGTYAIDWGADGTVEVKGKYSTESGKITIQDTEGSDCMGEAQYNYRIEDDTLTMTRITDPCPDRGGPDGIITLERG